MRTFRLKYLFCLILVVGVALMWGTWASGTPRTANRLLVLKECLLSMTYSDFLAEVPDTSFNRLQTGGNTSIRESRPIRRVRDLWMNTQVSYEVDYNSVDGIQAITWQADWPAIEAKAAEENWTFYRHVIVMVVAGLVAGWVVWPRRTNES
jgi:hypothetical protein